MIATRDIIASIESGNDQYLFRFEERVYEAAVRTDILAACSKHNPGLSIKTCRMILATSWGAYQDMGFEIYGELHYNDTLTRFLFNRAEQDVMFEDFISLRKIDFSVDDLRTSQDKREEFALHYNGPDNVAIYAGLIAEHIQKLAPVAA